METLDLSIISSNPEHNVLQTHPDPVYSSIDSKGFIGMMKCTFTFFNKL